MKKFTLEFSLDNDFFQQNLGQAIKKTLSDIGEKIEQQRILEGKIIDVNGNSIGQFETTFYSESFERYLNDNRAILIKTILSMYPDSQYLDDDEIEVVVMNDEGLYNEFIEYCNDHRIDPEY